MRDDDIVDESSVDVLDPSVAVAAPSRGGRADELASAVQDLRIGGGTRRFNERILMILGGILAPVGILLVCLGWYGASHTPNVYEQVPYMISGGLLGLSLVFLGSFFYFTHWLTELVKEHRAQSAAIVEAVGRLEDVIARTGGAHHSNGHKPVEPTLDDAAEAVRLVATARGTMAHREHCTVVAGKPGLREVDAADALLPCKLCDPYSSA